MIQGMVGGTIALTLLWLGYLSLKNETTSLAGFLAPLGQFQFLDSQNIALLLVIGWLLGATASVVSLRRFLKTWNSSRGER
jgi:cell division protein FtsX